MDSARLLLLLVLFALEARPGRGLRDVRISVPAYVLRGHSARLQCQYQLDDEALYSVKWYKGRHEFYRFTPNESPYKKVFPPLGNHVDLKQSSGTHVTLVNADESVSGRYSCEVSADAPSFLTFLVSDSMDVVDAPRQRPYLEGLMSRYRPGDVMNVTCTAGASRPPASLIFIVNGMQQDDSSVRERLPLEQGTSGLERSRVALWLPVTASLAPRVRVRCVASIGSVYWQSAEKSAAVLAPQDAEWPALTPVDLPEEHGHLLHDKGSHPHLVVSTSTPPADGEVAASTCSRQWRPHRFSQLLPLLLVLLAATSS